MIKYEGVTGKMMLLEIMKKVISNEIPEDWKLTIILPIFKKENEKYCKNYRGISLGKDLVDQYGFRQTTNRNKNIVDICKHTKVKQGGKINPIRFTYFMDKIIKETCKKNKTK